MLTKRQAYAKWLGIKEYPLAPNLYRLLGVDNFESDADIISNAADSRMGFLRQFQSGEHASLVAEILNEIAQARVTLLNAERKAAYDAQLAAPQASSDGPAADAVLVAEVAKPPVRRSKASPWAEEPPAMVAPPAPAVATTVSRRLRRASHAPMAVALGALAVIVGIVAFALLYGPGSPLASREPIGAAAPDESVEDASPKPVRPEGPPSQTEANTAPGIEPPSPPSPPPSHVAGRPWPVSPPLVSPPPVQPSVERVVEAPPEPKPVPMPPTPSTPVPAAPTIASAPTPPPPSAPPPAPPPVAEPEPVKAPVPDEAAQQAMLKLVSEVYGPHRKEAKTSDAQKKLAEEMLKTADSANSDVEGFVLLRVARDVAAGAGEAELAFQAIDEREQRWQIDAAEERHEALEKAAGSAKSSPQHESIACLAADLQDDAIEADDFPRAARYGEWALAAARSARNGELTKLLAAREKELAAMAVEYEKFQASLAVLKQTPADPQASLVAGRYYSLAKGDWDKGLALLANSPDERLKRLAQMELNETHDPLALGDGWWDFAQREEDRAKRNCLDRAGAWYVVALPAASGLPKAKIERRLEEIGEAVGDSGGSLMAATAEAEMRRLVTKTDVAKPPAASTSKVDAEEARRRELVSKRNVQKRQEMLGRIKQRQAENEATMRAFRSRYGLKVP